jgi:methionyl-tRNA synthetase
MPRALVTAALPYINNVPHVGHIVGSHLPADIIARYLRATGHDVLFVGGSDESGTTSELAARDAGLPVSEFCARLHEVHKAIYRWFGISYDIYSETTRSPEHHETTRAFFTNVHKNGFVSEGTQEQLYCLQDKRFLADRFVVGTCPHCAYEDAAGDQCERCGHFLEPKILKAPRCKLCGTTPELRTSKHLFLRLDALSEKLKTWIEGNGHWRSQVRAQALGWIREGLRERAITRDLEWGVKVNFPGFEDKVFYVWFDAPIGYLSFTKQLAPDRWKEFWQDPECRIYHVLGKDNIAFHTIFWPGMLMAEGTMNLPYRVDGLQYLNYEGDKISKSKRWGIFCEKLPEAAVDVDILRAYLTFLIPETADTEFRWDDFRQRINSDINDTLSNFIHRTLSLARSKLDGVVHAPAQTAQEADAAFLQQIGTRHKEIDKLLAAGELRAAFTEILALAGDGNKYFAVTQPWQLVKTDRTRAAEVLHLCTSLAATLAVLIGPFQPGASERAWGLVGLDGKPSDPGRWEAAASLMLPPRHTIPPDPKPIFLKLTPEEVARIRAIVTVPPDLAEVLKT